MYFSALFSIFAALFSIAQALNANKCSKELAEIVYEVSLPQGQYFARISKTLIAQTPLLFTSPQAPEIYKNFANSFNVNLFVSDPFTFGTLYKPDGTTTAIVAGNSYTSASRARAIINIPTYRIRDGVGYYSFIVYNNDGQNLVLTISATADQI